MTAFTPPERLRVNGSARPIGLGADAPLLSWCTDAVHHGAQVLVHDDAGTLIWDSGPVRTPLPRLRYAGPDLRSRSTYRWRVRTISATGQASPWSAAGEWETTLLRPEDWRAQWIARRTPSAHRIVGCLRSDRIAWIEPGHWLGQTFRAPGPVTAVSLGLLHTRGEQTIGRLEVCDVNGEPLAGRRLRSEEVPWDHFSQFLELTPALPAGDYLVRVHADRGRIGWRTLSEEQRFDIDDGVSPLPVRGTALRDGAPEPGTRALGVETIPAPNPIFQVSFTVPAGARQARLHAVGLGYGTFRLNDQPVSDDVLDPAPTDYDRSVLFRSHDVTHLLRPGTNTLTAALGRGYHSARGASVWAWNLAPWHREPMLLAQLEYRDEAGDHHIVASGPQWRAAAGPVTSDLLYTGERHDPGRLTGVQWESAIAVASPRGTLRPAPLPPVRRFAPMDPVSSRRLGRATVYDFGTVMAGRVRATITGEPGAEIIFKYGEHLATDGSVQCDNVLTTGEAQADRYVLSASPEQTWEPEFSYKGFRYVSVEPVGTASIRRLQGIPLHTDVASVGSFECENETLTWIDTATGRTFLNNLHGIPTDTPIYEKNGWTADAHLATEAVLHHFDLHTTFGKWLDDHVDAQSDDGAVPQIVPTPGWGRALDPAWSASMVLIPWNLYWEYGDLALLERYSGPALAYTDRLLDINGTGIWPLHSWGDWLSPGHTFAPEGSAPTATMMLHHVVTRAADLCHELGMTERATQYRQAAAAIARTYHDTYFDERSGSYSGPHTGYRQTMNVLPLAFDAVPAQHRAGVAQSLSDDIEHRTNGHLDCGAIGLKYLLPVLSAHGRDDLAITVAVQETAPGWGAWRQAGAHTLRESWDATARSHDHYFLGSPAAWIQQRVGALTATSPGWASFDVQPIHDERVTWARLSHRTVRGQASVRWRRTGSSWDVDVDVPAGAEATLRLPGAPPRRIGSGRHRLHEVVVPAR